MAVRTVCAEHAVGWRAKFVDRRHAAIKNTSSSVGATLTQHVDLSGASFPVTADSHYTWGLVTATVYTNRAEAGAIAVGGTAVSWLPSPATMWGGRILAALASYATSQRQCLKWKLVAIGVVVGQPMLHSGGYCR